MERARRKKSISLAQKGEGGIHGCQEEDAHSAGKRSLRKNGYTIRREKSFAASQLEVKLEDAD